VHKCTDILPKRRLARCATSWPIIYLPQPNDRLRRKRSPNVLPHESRAGAARHSPSGRIDEQTLVRVKSTTGNDDDAARKTRHALYCRTRLFGGGADRRVCRVLEIALRPELRLVISAPRVVDDFGPKTLMRARRVCTDGRRRFASAFMIYLLSNGCDGSIIRAPRERQAHEPSVQVALRYHLVMRFMHWLPLRAKLHDNTIPNHDRS
jgi:hypothetical protein